jgi:lysozyme
MLLRQTTPVACAAGLLVVAAASAAFSSACSSKATTGACSQSGSPLEVAAPVCPGPSIVKGVDVSTYDGVVDWPTVKGAGIAFAFARISDGTTHPDDRFAANWPGMKSAGIVRGAYQYFRASEDPVAQANLVVSALTSAGGLVAGDLPVVADVETADGQTSAVIETKLKTWLGAIEKATGKQPLIYTSVGTWPVTSNAFAGYTLWVANYGVTCPAMPTGWSKWLFWQTSATGTTKGIPIKGDLDDFNGTLADLLAFAGGAGTPPADAGPGTQDGGPPVTAPDAAPPITLDGGPIVHVDAGAPMGSGPCL